MRRPRLEETLDRIPPGGIGLVVAPAGSGKSILMGQWASRASTRTCHLRITAAHNDPVVFARALTSAIASPATEFDAHIADLLTAAASGIGEVFVSGLLAELENLDRDLVVLLDDVHHLTNGAICRDMDHVFDRLPDHLQFVLGARFDPPFRLQQLRLQGRIVEIRAAALAFDADESRGFIEAVAGRSLTDTQTQALVARTDGWAAGLQLAALSLQRVTDIDAFVRDFTGSDRLVADYLTEEVVDELEPDVRRFVLLTSILDWLSSDLCDAVTGDTNGDEMLDLLARRSLFLVHPDCTGERLRYHHLFADLLRYRLRTSEPARERLQRLQAAQWLLGHGHVADAIEQLLAAGDPEQVTRVITERGQEFFEREEAATLVRWLGAARAQHTNPPAVLDVNLLAAEVAAHQTGAAAECYRQLRRRPDLTHGEIAAAAALYACLGLDDLPPVEVLKAAAEALDLLGHFQDEVVIDFVGVGGRDTVEFLAECMTAVASLYEGKIGAGARQFESVLEMPGVQYRIWKLYALGGLALARALAGRCTEARSLATTAIAFAEANQVAHFHGLAFAHFALAQVALDQCDQEAVTLHLHASQSSVQRTGRASLRGLQRLLLIDQAAATGSAEAALAELRRAERGPGEPPLVVDLARAQEVRLLIDEAKLVQARALLATGLAASDAALHIDLELASGHVDAARQVLDHWDHTPDVRSTIQRILRTVAVFMVEGRSEAAALVLQEALSLAEREDLRRPFLEQPAAMRILRSEALRGSHAFAQAILEAAPTVATRDEAQMRLIEPLTDRECEVLDYLPTRLENKDIAAALFVSINTLKSHLRHIYSKLAVPDRDAAVTAAYELGLL